MKKYLFILGLLFTVPFLAQARGSLMEIKLDTKTPTYKVAASGSLNILAGIYKINGIDREDINLKRIALTLSGDANLSNPNSITLVTLKNSSGTTVGSAVFTSSNRFATSTLSSDFIIARNTVNKLYVYVDLSSIGATYPVTYSGSLIKVDYDGDNNIGTYGIGQTSGMTIKSVGNTTQVAGVRVMKSTPTFARLTLPSKVLTNSIEKPLLRFSVTANPAGNISMLKFTLGIATTGVNIRNINIHAFQDSGYSTPVSGHSLNGQLDNTDKTPTNTGGNIEIYAENSNGIQTGIVIPAGATRYFEVRGDTSAVSTGDSAIITLQGDAAYPALTPVQGLMANANIIDAGAEDDLIWSPYSTTTVGITGDDWTNGYAVPGLGASGITEVLSL